MKTLETFEGFVDGIRNGIAYFTLRSKPVLVCPEIGYETGDILWCECEASKLLDLGIKEKRKFKCWTVEQDDGSVTIEMEAIPDKVITEERWKEICRDIDERLGE
jgi:hypothetical protein